MRRLAAVLTLVLAAACGKATPPAKTLGQACDEDDPCAVGLVCDVGTCVTAGIGLACDGSNPCAVGLSCVDGVCAQATTSDSGASSGSAASNSSGSSGTTSQETSSGSSGISTGASGSTASTGSSASASNTTGSPTGSGSTTSATNASTSTGSSGSSATSSSAGTTSGTSGNCGACNNPPDACHATQGTCQAGGCVYEFIEGASCDDGNPCTVQDTCHAGACTGTPLVCDAPPAGSCVSGTELSTYDAQGACNGGRCVYTAHSVSCGAGGCVNGACQSDPCGSVSCDTPPSACFASAGSCSGGTCSYAYDDGATCNDNDACTTNDQCDTGVCRGTPISCSSPPANSCSNTTTAKVYAAAGSCAAGACSYSYSFVSCPTGCTNGACNASGWSPMTSNSNADLHSAWGTSATNVWVGGTGGTMLHYDGTRWTAKSSGVTGDIASISGTSASNIFAISTDHNYDVSLIHYNGTAWSVVGAVNQVTNYISEAEYGVGVVAVGANEAYVVGEYALVHVLNGTYTSEGAQTQLYGNEVGAGGWYFSPTEVWLTSGEAEIWNGTALSQAGSPAVFTGDYGAIWADSDHDVFLSQNGNVEYYDGTSFTLLNTGLNGNVTGLWGTGTGHVFASAAYDYYENSSPSVGFVLFWDGSGWTQQGIPASTRGLRAIYEAPSGVVFAVGDSGTILTGP